MSSIVRNLGVLSRCTSQYTVNRLSIYELNGNQYVYLLSVCEEPGLSQETLSRLSFFNKSNISRQLNDLEERGYIERRPSEEDRRIMQVYPTEKARKIYPLVQNVLQDWRELMLEEFNEEEIALLHRMLNRMAERANAYLRGEPL